MSFSPRRRDGASQNPMRGVPWHLRDRFRDFDHYRTHMTNLVMRDRASRAGQFHPARPLSTFLQHILDTDVNQTGDTPASPFPYPEMRLREGMTAQDFHDRSREWHNYMQNMNFAWDAEGNPTGVDIGGYGSPYRLLDANMDRLRGHLPEGLQFRPGASQYGDFSSLPQSGQQMQARQNLLDRERVQRRGSDDDVIQDARPIFRMPR